MSWTTQIATVLLLAASSVICSPTKGFPQARLSEAEWSSYHEREPEGPGTYAFGYDVEDPATGNTQFRQEERRLDGSVTGSYGSVQPDGNIQVVHYTADHLGYRVRIENSIRKNEDFPPNPSKHSPEFESALASQSAPVSSLHEQHVRPISVHESQGQHSPPITAQRYQPLHNARPITVQGKQPSYNARPIRTQSSQGLRVAQPIAQDLRGVVPAKFDKAESQNGVSPQGLGASNNQYPSRFPGISKVRKVYPISDQDLRRQFSRPSDWQKMVSYDFNYA